MQPIQSSVLKTFPVHGRAQENRLKWSLIRILGECVESCRDEGISNKSLRLIRREVRSRFDHNFLSYVADIESSFERCSEVDVQCI